MRCVLKEDHGIPVLLITFASQVPRGGQLPSLHLPGILCCLATDPKAMGTIDQGLKLQNCNPLLTSSPVFYYSDC